ncbi:exodeoxyribonuclease VII large subunit [Mesobacillus boroniphilus JCM 21738]|uniref:Exodeoxyribonuclease VII large subunit n=1 Tax=Mesobacillus boroniphilus JCM 21738 TaxID=1294265 RepID=W4RMX9_9BACI|nr:exodeoxyribonuclease VII large subunit [Mesobacillus boroniphilus JCM 21738]
MRAPTPTGAAELAVPHIQELIERVMNRETRLMRAMREKVFFQQKRYQRLIRSYAFRYPRKLYEQKLEQVDKLTESLTRGAEKLYFAKNDALLQLKRRLERSHPEELRKVSAERHMRTTRALNRAMTAVLSEKRKEFNGILSTLEALSPLKIMDRGYSLAYTDDGELIKTVTQVKPQRKINVKLYDGSIQCVVTDIKESENNGR